MTGTREFRRTTSLTQITVVKQPPSDSPVTPKINEGESSESPREYTRMRRRSINIPTLQNYSYNTYTDDTASFLATCGLCQRRLPPGRDIFMYRGDTAYCSVECREEQMEDDERKEQCNSIKHSPTASLANDNNEFSHHILDNSPAACALTSDPAAAAKPATFAAA